MTEKIFCSLSRYHSNKPSGSPINRLTGLLVSRFLGLRISSVPVRLFTRFTPNESSQTRAVEESPGFTLIELMVVITLSAFILMAATGMFISTLISDTKTSVRQRLLREGEAALSNIEFTIRNSKQATCNGNRLSTIDLEDNTTTFAPDQANPTRLATVDATGATTGLLTSESVQLANLSFVCETANNGTTYVTTSFILEKQESGIGESQTPIDLQFTSGTTVRN